MTINVLMIKWFLWSLDYQGEGNTNAHVKSIECFLDTDLIQKIVASTMKKEITALMFNR